MHTAKLSDILSPQKVDDRSADEIIAAIVSGAGLEIVEDELV